MLVDIKKRKARKIKMEWWDIKILRVLSVFCILIFLHCNIIDQKKIENDDPFQMIVHTNIYESLNK